MRRERHGDGEPSSKWSSLAADVIDDFLTEINVTSPTGIRAIRNLSDPDVAAMTWDRIEDEAEMRASSSLSAQGTFVL
jgi:hypothetical protein